MLTSDLHCIRHHRRLRGLLPKIRLEGFNDYELVEGILCHAHGIIPNEARV